MTTSTRAALVPLYLAGFTTAFGAHGVASVLGAESDDIGLTLLSFGLVLALYDIAEVVLKPIFGALSDRIGVRPVIVGGLLAFAVASAIATFIATPLALALIRLGQGAAASAFSPASSSAVARLAGQERLGRYFGRYGAWKSMGYLLGPIIGILVAHVYGIAWVYGTLAVLAVGAALLTLVLVPSLPPLPKQRSTLSDLWMQLWDRSFLIPTLVLATSTAVLGVAVGFLPLLATRMELHPVVGAVAVALVALVSSVLQPMVGAARDRGRLSTAAGSTWGLLLATSALVLLAALPHPVTLFLAAAMIGAMLGVVTPLAFSHLAAATAPERMGRTMGSAELGREVGDAAGPLLVGAVATATAVPFGLLALAGLTAGAGLLSRGLAIRGDRPRTDGSH
ncbi:MFS transporter [Microbacterium oxydans]|uniref:Inner membrane transport protein YajR n=1 Tax=Microbacterium oxydans TaxID=82380 RepID=A0A0F0LBQ6_9MICO|nr:MFS transporter [Microbacterium oxydans]KJL28991.1 Inner membrane transport protein YajR [Microbacterium oxydans]